MRSSTSSSEKIRPILGLRLTASDRPGVAQPVPERDIPGQPWRLITVVSAVLFVLLVGGWEWHWRSFGSQPATENSNGLWARERRRIDTGDGRNTVVVGDSRMLFDFDLDTWQRLSAERPIQLAIEGTSGLFVLEDLAEDPHFKGRILVGVAPQVFFLNFGFRADVVKYYHKDTPSQRVGQWLAMHTVDRLFGFYNADFALGTVLRRQDWWPARAGVPAVKEVRKLAVSAPDRNTEMWSKVVDDAAYRSLVQSIWAQRFGPRDAEGKAKLEESIRKQIERAVVVVAKLRARGIPLVFVRLPSAGAYAEYERRDFPRANTWDALLAKTGVPGVNYEDYPDMQGYSIPEWSHIAACEKPHFTTALYGAVARQNPEFLARKAAP